MSSKLVRQAKRLVLGTVMVSVGLWTMPVQAQVSDAQVGALVQALRDAAQQRAPGNNGLVSEWQILPVNIPRWSKQCIGRELTPTQFEADSTRARSILVCVMRDVLRDQYKASGNNEAIAVRRTASWWLTGNPNQYNSGSTASYSQNVLSFYQKQRPNSQAQQPAPSPKPAASGRATQPAPQPSAKPTASASSSAQISNAQVGRLVEALRLAAQQRAPGNNGLVSEWQILPVNIPRWSKQCTGRELTPTQFEGSPVTARSILVCVMRDVMRDQYAASGSNEAIAVRRTASWWLTGDPNQYNSGATATFSNNVLGFYQQQSSSSQAQQPAPSPAASGQAAQPTTTQSPATPQPSPQPTASASSSAQVSNAQVGRLVEALVQAAPQDKADDDLYGAWQVKAENIPRWSNQCIGRELTPTQFQDSPTTARSILVCVMGNVMRDQYQASNNNESLAVQRAASWWLTGDPNQYNSGAIAGYAQKVLSLYQKPAPTAQQPTPTVPQPAPTLKFFSHI